jgi:phenylpropionate dioxygenase-like ring-hydroxylating dioxygenase large terminal subunit
MSTDKFHDLPWDVKPGAPLPPWTYTNPEVFELDYEAFFLRRWQLIGHVNDVPDEGNFITHDIGRDNVFVIRGKDDQLRAFQNVCRHRASRVLEGKGTCRGVIRCPYHGWTYQLDGSLMAIPRDEHFPDVDKATRGLHEIQLEIFHGLLFVRVRGEGPSVAEHFGSMASFFEKYDVANYVPCAETTTQVWNVNWKVAWDNYLENYHIPIGHPGLHRLLNSLDEGEDLSSGVGYGVFDLKSKPSNVDVERRYQEMFHHANDRIPEDIRSKWVQIGFAGNVAFDMYPEMMDIFQLIPLGHDRTLIRAAYFGHPDATPEEAELRRLNIQINDSVNAEDSILCERVQKGLQTYGYSPGPLSQLEIGVHYFHEMVRELVPVTSLADAPAHGQVAAQNNDLLTNQAPRISSVGD